jgi:outer membrane lipoprotein-sorting protein
MKQILFLALFIAVQYNLQAQCATKNTDVEAKKVLDAVTKKIKTFTTVSAKFTIKSENAAGKTLSSKTGTFSAKGNKYKVNFTGQEIFCDGVTVWTYEKTANEVTISNFDNSNSSITPQKLFTNFYDKDFLYKLNGESKDGGKTVQEIEMTPCNKSRPYSKVYIYIDKSGNLISKAKILEKGSNQKNTLAVNSLTPNAAIADASFKFDKNKYPGVEVIDLR